LETPSRSMTIVRRWSASVAARTKLPHTMLRQPSSKAHRYRRQCHPSCAPCRDPRSSRPWALRPSLASPASRAHRARSARHCPRYCRTRSASRRSSRSQCLLRC
jgi:hypothetical protein